MNRRIILICILLIALLVSGCPTPKPPTPRPTPTPSAFTMEVKLDKPVYKIGEFIIISVRATRSCYLSLYDISTLGEVTQIFPNQLMAYSDNFIQGNQLYRIPAATDKFDFEISGPPGVERVRAVCTTQNVNLFQEQTAANKDDEVFPKIQVQPAPFEQSLNDELKVIPAGRWAEASVTFQVQ